jgi:membrane associated rhomboid family serine protease
MDFWVIRLVIANAIIFMLQSFLGIGASAMTFGLIPAEVLGQFRLYQLCTYMFFHGGFDHLLFNMYALFIFGVAIEQVWGSARFLRYYFFCGVGAGVSIALISLLFHREAMFMPTIGASGAVFGLLLAFGMLFPNAEILLFFFIPLKAKYLVVLYGGLELLFELSGGMGNVSHVGHLGGLVFGLIYFLIHRKKLRHEGVDVPGLDTLSRKADAVRRKSAGSSRVEETNRYSDEVRHYELKQSIIRKLIKVKGFHL